MAAEEQEFPLGTRIMAKRCGTCPACKAARNHPDTRFGKAMAWHGSWCPFWKAYEKVNAAEVAKSGMSAG